MYMRRPSNPVWSFAAIPSGHALRSSPSAAILLKKFFRMHHGPGWSCAAAFCRDTRQKFHLGKGGGSTCTAALPAHVRLSCVVTSGNPVWSCTQTLAFSWGLFASQKAGAARASECKPGSFSKRPSSCTAAFCTPAGEACSLMHGGPG